MARLRQQYPRNYGTSDNISLEFENLIRYLIAGERGNKTFGELMTLLFNADGEVEDIVELRKDSSEGLQYRVGTYAATDTESGWVTLISNADLRGEKGQDFGEIGAPIIFGRVDYTATASQTTFDYAHDETDELLVYVNGALQVPGGANDYTSDHAAGTAGQIEFNSGLNLNDNVSVYKIRATSITGYTRSDTLTTATQTVFPFIHTDETQLLVFKNGILQRFGGSFDYVNDPGSDTVTFTSAVPSGNLITIITVENTSQVAVTGMMFESNYTNPETGLIKYAKVEVADNEIPEGKVNGLTAKLIARPTVTVAASAPGAPNDGDLWVDTSQTPPVLQFREGTAWLQASPDALIPSVTEADALKLVRVNGSGNGYELAAPDYSSLIPLSQKGVANGVASTDAEGRVPADQGPLIMHKDSLYHFESSASDTTYDFQRFYKTKFRIVGISVQTASGSCTVQLSVNGVLVGTTYAASSTTNTADINPGLEVDALASPKIVSAVVTGSSAPSDLEITVAIEFLAE